MEKIQISWNQKSDPYRGDLLVSGYASVFDVIDNHNDIIVKGSFSTTIQNNRKNIKFLWQHDPKFPIGKITKIFEDIYGLYIEACITSGTEKGREAIDLLSKNIINGLSVGFKSINSYTNAEGRRVITELDLWEISMVTFPSNQQSEIHNKHIEKSLLISALEEAKFQISLINQRSKNGCSNKGS